VRPVPVDVMHGLVFEQGSTQVLSHDEAVFKDVAVNGGHREVWMLGLKTDLNVPFMTLTATPLPPPVPFTTNVRDDAVVVQSATDGLRGHPRTDAMWVMDRPSVHISTTRSEKAGSVR